MRDAVNILLGWLLGVVFVYLCWYAGWWHQTYVGGMKMNLLDEGLRLQAASIGHSTEAKVEKPTDQPAPRMVSLKAVLDELHDMIGDTERYEMFIDGRGPPKEWSIEPRYSIGGDWMRSDDVEQLLHKLEKALG